VGVLFCRTHKPDGVIYPVYEGKNFIGRSAGRGNDVCIPDDGMISDVHLMVLYRDADRKFKFEDQNSSHGTYINGALTDNGELHNNDVITIGETRLLFMLIPEY